MNTLVHEDQELCHVGHLHDFIICDAALLVVAQAVDYFEFRETRCSLDDFVDEAGVDVVSGCQITGFDERLEDVLKKEGYMNDPSRNTNGMTKPVHPVDEFGKLFVVI